ncbi:MAG: hypothetical protein ACHQ4G_05955 [Opitutales bacterium]
MNVQYGENFVPVIHVVDSRPVILIDGAEQTVTTTPVYVAERAPLFGPEHVQLLSASLGGGVPIKAAPGESDESDFRPATTFGLEPGYFVAELLAPEALHGGFVVVTVFSDKIFQPDADFIRPVVLVNALPDLPAGQTVKASFAAPYVGGRSDTKYFVQIFDHEGREVRVNGLGLAWKYYALVERTKLKQAIFLYETRFMNQNHAASPLVTVRPVFPAGFTPPVKPAVAVLDVNADGLVSAVALEQVDDAVTREAVTNALDGWLFLPQLKAGSPVPTRVKVPLQF